MNKRLSHEKAYAKAVRAQSEAADPSHTRMVSANAGSGKTRVLVDRVSRILLREVEPDKILCLTYTKAAATEMQDRLYEKLGQWSVMAEAGLREELKTLLGEDYSNIAVARRLFAKALETPEGLKVQTIHAFCERILSRFPIEAGIMPGYEPIEEAEIALISEEVRHAILTQAMENPDGEIDKAIQTLTLKMSDQTMDELFKWMAYSGEKIKTWERTGGVSGLAKTLGIELSVTVEALAEEFWNKTNVDELKHYIPILKGGSKTDQLSALRVEESLADSNPVSAFYIYKDVFFTQSGGLRKKPVTKKTMELSNDFFSSTGPEAERVTAMVDAVKAVELLSLTHAVFTLAKPYTRLYAQAKRDRRGLDFNDQILLVRDLLNNRHVSEWVRYKLDGGIEHILLDEAQDTSPEQWDIINSLSEAFIQDNPDRDPNKPRTLFAVGDEKQSIYGFQGAKPEQFLTEIQSRLTGKAKQVRMSMSFRSSQTILDVVDSFLEAQRGRLEMFDTDTFPPASDIEPHIAYRNSAEPDASAVDLWPLSLKPEKEEDKPAWDTTPVDAVGPRNEREVLAKELALQIRHWLDNGEPIFDREAGTVRALEAGDILILVRTRGGRGNSLYDAIIRHLKRNAIPLAGADRVKLADALIVRDLLALSRFCLLPDDDLSLAELLKSPVFGLDDMDLLALAKGRQKRSLWSAVKRKDEALAQILRTYISLSEKRSPYEFFISVLDSQDINGHSVRHKFYCRLGLEAREALDVFLTRAMEHQQKGVPSLLHFIRGFDGDDAEVKRDMDAAKGLVRVMTVHGAKGLEAPMVILPDTTQSPTYKELLVPLEKGCFLKPSNVNLPEALVSSVEAGKAKVSQEQLRLLYVALTRAETRLVICGFQSQPSAEKPVKEDSWYDWMNKTVKGLETKIIETPFGEGLRFGCVPENLELSKAELQKEQKPLPQWALQPARHEVLLQHPVAPSRLLAENEMDEGSEFVQGLSPRLRGVIIHQLLEILPNFSAQERLEKASVILKSYTQVSERDIDGLLKEVFAVLESADLKFLWGEGSRAEVSLAGHIDEAPNDYQFSAKIDRLCVMPDEVLVVDYKSNRDVPEQQDSIEDVYWGQMAAYRALVQKLYPTKSVKCILIWTAHTKVMVLDDDKLDDALTKIASLPTYDTH